MKASRLIEVLEQAIEARGDVGVYVPDRATAGGTGFRPLTEARVIVGAGGPDPVYLSGEDEGWVGTTIRYLAFTENGVTPHPERRKGDRRGDARNAA